jgi:CheY-like chemotaxis protein
MTKILRVLFFDDYPLQSENALFLEMLRKRIEDRLGGIQGLRIHIEPEKTLSGLENRLKAERITLAILDIMAMVPQDFGPPADDSQPTVTAALAGVEVLKRCRAGRYGTGNQQVSIFMRTARGEPHVRELCAQAGADGYYLAGTSDRSLINAAIEVLCAAVSKAH